MKIEVVEGSDWSVVYEVTLVRGGPVKRPIGVLHGAEEWVDAPLKPKFWQVALSALVLAVVFVPPALCWLNT